MRSILQGGLIVVSLMIASAEVAEAQIVTIQSSGYSAANPPVRPKDTTQPNGKFSTLSYPNGDGGQFRVRIDYGITASGGFVVYAAGNTAPSEDFTTVENVGRGVTNKVWGIGGLQQWVTNASADDMVLAQLQRRINSNAEWTPEVTVYFYVKP